MTDKTEKAPKTPRPENAGKAAPTPFEGVPDHAPTAPVWKYVLLVGLFAVWVGILVLVRVLGQR